MANFSSLSPKTVLSIMEGSITFVKKPHPLDAEGWSYRVYYPNGYGASIIKFKGSYGHLDDLWEVAVLLDDKLCYDTPITDDVLGYLTEEEVVAVCNDIFHL